MAGFEPEPKKYLLKFEDYPGLEVTAREPSLGELLELQELAEVTDSTGGTRKLFRKFAEHLVSWNLTRDGKPVPATFEGLLTQGGGLVTALTEGFINAVTGVPRGLGKDSSSGGSVPEELSLALASSSRPLGS